MAPNSFTHGGVGRDRFPPQHPDLPPPPPVTFPFQSRDANSSSPDTLNEGPMEGPVYNTGGGSSSPENTPPLHRLDATKLEYGGAARRTPQRDEGKQAADSGAHRSLQRRAECRLGYLVHSGDAQELR
ncbi:hypothetical protein PG990_002297 [Apiospora arundinis]